MVKNKSKILLYDIETAYTVGAVWGLYEQNVVKVLREPYIITVSWKWLGDKTTQVMKLPDFPLYKKDKKSDKALVEKLRDLFDEAEVIIAHNGNSFDQKWSYGRFLVHGMKPPSPSKYIDTKVVAKSKFRFNSNSLNSLGEYLDCGQKLSTGGIDLWVGCIERDDKKSWKTMCDYNKQDVVLLEQVYLKLLPYMTNHPNSNLLNNTVRCCPNCGENKLVRSKKRMTASGWKIQYQCGGCGAYCTSSVTERAAEVS